MSHASPGQYSFAGGELSPLLEGRQDLTKYPIGCRRMRNMFPQVQGPARLRGGTRVIATVKSSSDRTWLQSFIFSQTDAVIQEWGDQYVRFYTNRAQILAPTTAWSDVVTYAAGVFVTFNGNTYRSLQAANLDKDPEVETTWWALGGGYEIPSPYSDSDLLNADGGFALSFAQSADVQYIAFFGYKPQTLSRTSNTNWAFADYDPEDGPFEPQNIDKDISVVIDVVTGTITLTNDATDSPVPTGTDDRLIRIEETDKSAVKPWETGKRIAAVSENPIGEFRRSDGHVYECTTNQVVGGGEIEIRTGSVKPIHTEGVEGDGDGEPLYSGATLFAIRVGVDWLYLHSGYGTARITDCDGTDATMTGILDFPASIITPGSYRWSLGAWYEGHYPSSVAFYRDRLIWSGNQRVWASVAGGYDSHAADEFGEVLPDSAIDVLISVGGQDQVNWMIPQPDALLIGTGGGELVFEEITRNAVLGPANCKFELQGSNGSRKIQPINIAEYTVFVQKGGLAILEAQYAADQARFVSTDLCDFSEHITGPGIVAMAFAQNPSKLLWCLRSDGLVACLVYNRADEVIAWSLHDFGGFVESIAVIPSATPGLDDLYLIIRRDLNCVTARYIEVLLPPHQAPYDPIVSCYQDASVTYDGAKNATLQPGDDAVTVGATAVPFVAGSAVFVSGDVGRFIQYRYYVADTELWMTALAEITAFTSSTEVAGTIIKAFPPPLIRVIVGEGCSISADPALIAALAWRMSATEISGLEYLAGETVRITVDGAKHADQVVSNDGEVTLTRPGFVVHVGLPMRGYLQLMNLDAGAQDGTSQGKIKKIPTVGVRLFETQGGQYGPNLVRLDRFQYYDTVMDEPPPLFSGDKSVNWNNAFETEGRITLVFDDGQPATVCAVYPQVETHDNRVGSRYS